MKKLAFLSGALVAGALFAGAISASAADLPRKTAPVIPAHPPAFTWEGFYIGGNAGFGFGSTSTAGTLNGVTPVAAQLFRSPDGFVGGAQIGYNFQFHNNIVLGLETDIQGTSLESEQANVFGATSRSTLFYYGTVRGRIGYAFSGTNSLLDRTLLYVTGGFSYGQNSPSITRYVVPTNRQVSFVVGGGLEYAVTNNWTVRGEAFYVDLGEDSFRYVNANPVIPVISTRNQLDFVVVRAGVNYKF